MTKKGMLAFEVLIWIIRIILVIIIIMGVTLQINRHINTKVSLYILEPALITQIIGNSPVFFKMDPSGGYYRVVSLERFKNAGQALNDEFYYVNERYVAANITLLEKDGTLISSIMLNPKYYDELAPQAQIVSAITSSNRAWPVLIDDKGTQRQGIMDVEVLQST